MSDRNRWVLLPLLDLDDVGCGRFPGRGTTYYFKLAGHDVQVYLTEKRKRVRVFVDYKEWTPDG